MQKHLALFHLSPLLLAIVSNDEPRQSDLLRDPFHDFAAAVR
jgi:hypothetical protein